MDSIDRKSYEKISNLSSSFGYKYFDLIELDDDLIELSNKLSEDRQIKAPYFEKLNTNITFLRSSLSIFDDLGIQLQDVKVFENKFAPKFIKYCKYSDVISKSVHGNIIETHPRNILITLIPGYHFSLNFSAYVAAKKIYNSDDSFIPVFSEIKLPKADKYLTACSYSHEIAHTQLIFNDGRCDNYLNTELLPILIEQLFAYNFDKTGMVLRKERIKRLKTLSDNLKDLILSEDDKKSTYYEKLKLSTYIQSNIQAIALMGIYLANNENVKKELCGFINDIFGYKRSIDDMLNYYGCNMSDVSKDIKLYKKTRF